MLELVATEPSVAARLLRTLAATVRDLDDRRTDATVRDVPARVATWLVRRCADGRAPLHPGHAGLGAEIGATRVSVNRALRPFERRGMIEIGAREVIVLDRPALARVAAFRTAAEYRTSVYPCRSGWFIVTTWRPLAPRSALSKQ
ncbi:Crp/Fnr family transcriptional regulator [Nonomuraea turkmeniaca]|uniref:Crp/Fnr family transcriptional regulator n=1 Tax=Nonomuraea turkmeniaca TaxID=103838 RepID=UPI001B86BF1A|nr:helix-turn-helix domain-containing protein [Nonomuraea turkmeniaca]